MQESSFAGTVVTVPDCNLEYSVERLRRFRPTLYLFRSFQERFRTVADGSGLYPFFKGYRMERSRRFPTVILIIGMERSRRFLPCSTERS